MLAKWMLPVLLAGLTAGTGCMQGARFAEVDDQGGVVIFPLKKDRESIYSSPFRAEALAMIEKHCQGRYIITKEGETQPQTRMSGLDADDILSTRRFWGLRFRCKES